MTPFVTACAGFLLAVLWFDLLFDVQTLRHREGDLPEPVLASIAGYYARVTTEARPLNRLVSLSMLGLLASLGLQIAGDTAPNWSAWASLALAVAPISLAGAHTFRTAIRLSTRRDSITGQSRFARAICRDHLLCLASMASLMAIQLGWSR